MAMKPKWLEGFVEHLHELRQREQRGALAHLRRGLGKAPGSVHEMHPHIIPWLPTGQPWWTHYDEDVCYTVAALFAAHPAPGGRGSLGAAMHRLAQKQDRTSLERRFVALLAAPREDLPERLRHSVSLLAANGVPVDWLELANDLRNWSRPQRFVQRQWARDFWARPEGPSSDNTETTTTATAE